MPSMYDTTDSSFQNAEGTKIFTQSWLPKGTPPTAVMLWSHGIQEHCGRFEAVFRDFCDAGIAVYAWDHIGHGRSGGMAHQFPKGFDGVVADGLQYARMVRAGHPDVPLMLGGVSFGGLVVSHMALEASKVPNDLHFAAAVLVAPAIDVKWTPILKAQAAIGALLAKFLPNARLVPGAPVNKLSNHKAAVDEYKNDPLTSSSDLRSKVGYETLKGFKRLKKRYAEFTIPLLVLHGEEDVITDKDASEKFVRLAGSVDKTFVLLPNTAHLVLHEPDHVRVIRMIRDFILTRQAGSGAKSTTPPGVERMMMVEDAVPGGQFADARL